MPNFDRGFIKWQPFNSVINGKDVLIESDAKEKNDKPILFEEKLSLLNEKILEAYYAQNKVLITFYEQNKIKNIDAIITKINPNNKTITLNNNKTIVFNQIININ